MGSDLVAGQTREMSTVSHPVTIKPEEWLRFVQIDPFPRQWKEHGLDDDFKALESSS